MISTEMTVFFFGGELGLITFSVGVTFPIELTFTTGEKRERYRRVFPWCDRYWKLIEPVGVENSANGPV